MPTIEDYAKLAPFSLRELVEAVNSILRHSPRLHVQERTVRYYISKGLLNAPSGPPKTARYDVEHLRRVVHIRQWLERGARLEEARARIAAGEHGGETEVYAEYEAPRMYREHRSFDAPRQPLSVGEAVTRIPLGAGSTLEIQAGADLGQELDRVIDRIYEIRKNLHDST